MNIWRRLKGKVVIIEIKAWTGFFRVVRTHWAGWFTPPWLELETMTGVRVFIHSSWPDVVREPTVADYTSEIGISLFSVAGMVCDTSEDLPPPPSEDREEVNAST